jgi:hypothetical protein
MATDDRDIVDVLKAELDFIEKGGYGRSVRTPWKPTVAFQDSPSCLAFPIRSHDEGCVLMRFVPPELRCQSVPCHHIPLNDAGETAATLEQQGDQQKLEEALKNWLRAEIKQIEEEHAKQVAL